jgi:hypothetical protein
MEAHKQCSHPDHEGNRSLPLSAFYNDKTSPSGKTSNCKECIKRSRARYRKANRDVVLERQRLRYAADPDYYAERNHAYYKANKHTVLRKVKEYAVERWEQYQEYYAQYYQKHRKTLLERSKRYGREQRGKVLAVQAKRRCALIQRTPSWFATDKDRVDALYELARKLSLQEGTPYHVDHVIPLQGKLVSGLHCADNLQIIPAEENFKKSNKFSPT